MQQCWHQADVEQQKHFLCVDLLSGSNDYPNYIFFVRKWRCIGRLLLYGFQHGRRKSIYINLQQWNHL